MIVACFDKVGGDHLLRCALEGFQHLMVHSRMHIKSQVGQFFNKVYLRQLTIAANTAQQWSRSNGAGSTQDKIVAAAASSGVSMKSRYSKPVIQHKSSG